MKNTIYILCACFLLISCNENSEEQEQSTTKSINPLADPAVFIGQHKAKAMILGLFHFNNPGLDTYKQKYDFDILSDERQLELNALLERIAAYQPTKILLEWNRISGDSIANDRYQNYLSGNYDISNKRNEVYQIGFKLAKKLGHSRIYCSDTKTSWFGVELDWDQYNDVAYMKEHHQYEKTMRYDYDSFYELGDSLKTSQTLTEHLRMTNDPKNRLKDHQAYLTTILEGAGDNYLGADGVANWYQRNLRIFANAYDFTDFDQEERLLLIYGSGHVWQLRQFFTDSPDYDYVEVNDYLVN